MCDEITNDDGTVLFKIDEEHEALSVYIRPNATAEWSAPVLFDANELWELIMPRYDDPPQ